MKEVTLSDDKCLEVELVEGSDSNGNYLLDTNETWIYKCDQHISATTENKATATGKACGETAIATAKAVVQVGGGVSPFIKVNKEATPMGISSDGLTVDYSYKVSNPGILTLSNVTLTDDKCSNVKFEGGDANSNNKLEATEIWKYSCRTLLKVTTTNVATAKGEAEGMTAIDVASATVTVGEILGENIVPRHLPETGGGGAATRFDWAWGGAALLLALVTLSIASRPSDKRNS